MYETKAFINASRQKQKTSRILEKTKKFILQWHVTDLCNLNCKHCYRDGAESNPSLSELLDVLGQFYDLLTFLRKVSGTATHGHVNLTGGEPFLNSSFMDLLNMISSKSRLSFAILTNGTLIDAETTLSLKKLKPAYVQVSIEGTRETHDQIRGEGSFEKASSGIANLVAAGIPVYISFTAHRNNYKEFQDVVKHGRKLGVSLVWADRLIPCGNAQSLTNDMLSPDETRSFFEIMKGSRKKKLPLITGEKKVAMHRALQFLVGNGEPYRCNAGSTLITILPNGDVLPCRRMPVVVGNVGNKHLTEIYQENTFLKSLRDENKISRGCEQCFYQKFCRGGLRCLSHAVKGDPFHADPGCWIAQRRENDNNILNNSGVCNDDTCATLQNNAS
ncbi:MAG: radical SAM protein [Smithella sp.]